MSIKRECRYLATCLPQKRCKDNYKTFLKQASIFEILL